MGGHLHVEHAAFGREAARALIAVPGAERPAALARAFLAAKVLPSVAFSVADLYAYLELGAFAVVLVHLRLERVDPYLLLAGARRRSPAPVLALGAEPMPASEVRALGCDRYLQDSLPPAAVVAEATQLGTRAEPLTAMCVQRWGPLSLYPGRREAGWRGRPLDLTPMQFGILLALVDAAGAVVTPSELARRLWGPGTVEDTERIVAHVRRIRKRIEEDPANPRFLLTVRGVGFRLTNTAHAAAWQAPETPGDGTGG
jgi:DNA-binding response OmpR family regulator